MNSHIKDLFEREEAAIAAAIADGRRDPRQNPDLWKSFEFQKDGETYRQFIVEYDKVPFSKIQPKQVRERITDEHRLAAVSEWIEVDGGILDPIITSHHSPYKELCQHGHHRLYAHRGVMDQSEGVPRFLQGRQLYKVTLDSAGDKVYSPATNVEYKRFVSRTIVNPAVPNLDYKMADVVTQFNEAVELDAGLDGLKNPADKITREHFIDWIAGIHTRQFLSYLVRCKIFKAWERQASHGTKQVKPYRNTGECLDRFKALGWDSSHLHEKNTMGSWYDSNNDVLIAKTETNGDRLDAQVFIPLLKKYHSGALSSWVNQGVSEVYLYLEIDSKPVTYKADLKSVEGYRDLWQEKVVQGNELLAKCNVPFQVSLVYFPDQLQDPLDKGRLSNLKAIPAKPAKPHKSQNYWETNSFDGWEPGAFTNQ